jgi:hypothetical protein
MSRVRNPKPSPAPIPLAPTIESMSQRLQASNPARTLVVSYSSSDMASTVQLPDQAPEHVMICEPRDQPHSPLSTSTEFLAAHIDQPDAAVRPNCSARSSRRRTDHPTEQNRQGVGAMMTKRGAFSLDQLCR